jgi:3D (Asp-Asp-Asp) domain-containing protein/uncharacterized protein YabE (DUF348 family)
VATAAAGAPPALRGPLDWPSSAEQAPRWGLAKTLALCVVLWSTVSLPTVGGSAPWAALTALGAELTETLPCAGQVVLGAFPGMGASGAPWTLVEADGKAIRAPGEPGTAEAAAVAAGVRLQEGDRVLHLASEGTPAAGPVPPLAPWPGLLTPSACLPAPAARVVVQRAVPFSVIDQGVPMDLRAAATTVGEALQSAGVALHQADLVWPATEALLAPGMKVMIERAPPVVIEGPGVWLETRTRAAIVGELLAEQALALGPLDRVEPALDAPVPAWGAVRLVRVWEEEHREEVPIPFRTVVRPAPDLAPGVRQTQQHGEPGLAARVTRVTFENGVEVARSEPEVQVVREAVDEVIGAGPAPTPAPAALPDGTPARRVLSMVATAYDPGPASTGKSPGQPGYGITASGLRAGYGVVAVDPRVIPLGTRLYIPGYGTAVAGDTGGAIKGNRIDLGFATYGEAVRWGRRTVAVYVLS